MTRSIDIHEDTIKGLTPELKNPDVFEGAHHLVSENNPLLHLLHETMMSGLQASTSYEEEVLHAVETGVKTYEALSITSIEPIPSDFAVNILVEREKNPNFGVFLAEQMADAREKLFDTNYQLALGVYAVCSAHIKQPALVSTYSIGGAAMMRSVHQDVHQFWQFEKAVWS